MYFNQVRIPDEIRFALEEDRLVIFSGAGISIPPPSNLPNFDGLASQIAGGGVVGALPVDRFLGKLAQEKKTDVHAAAARILYGDHTKPTLLHHEILRLFQSAVGIRVVTTNFDDHFSAAARKVFPKARIREFCAPALPLGDDFTGLVYLHGSARLSPEKLVLTDRDFGAAYMTRGWARDFLVSLFSRYTVLFVGYRHSDLTITYLARGLDTSQIGRRWAMVPSSVAANDRENWDHLEISTIEYPIDPGNSENKHQALTEFFSQWADHAKESVFDKAKRAKTIAKGLPPENEADSAYVRNCFSDPQLANVFCRAIRHPAWVGWMHRLGYFDSFFTDTHPPTNRLAGETVLAGWLSSEVRRRYPDLLLEMIRVHGQKLSPEFCRMMAQMLWSEQQRKPDQRFATWLSVLLGQGRSAVHQDIWCYLLQECRIPEHIGVTLQLFEFLTTPEVHIEGRWGFSALNEESANRKRRTRPRIDYSIKWPLESSYWLREAWTKSLEPHLPEVGELLAQIIVKQFTYAYLLLRGVGEEYEHFDPLSGRRSSIAPHEQDDVWQNDILSCLIDFLRSILDHWIGSDASKAKQFADRLWSTKLRLLARFALYARNQDPQYGADERIQWVLRHDLVFNSGMKKEVFDILASAFPKAAPAVRRRLIRRIQGGYRGAGAKKLDPLTLDYEKFNVLVLLRRSDPECPLIESAISEIRDVHPEFGEREHPEFGVWHGKVGWIDPTEGVDFDQIISDSPEHFAVEMLRLPALSGHHDLWSTLRCLPRLFKQDKEWGRGFVEALTNLSTPSEIWDGVFWAWRDTIETTHEWEWVLNVIETLPQVSVIYSGVANLISHGFAKHRDEWNEELIDRAAALIARSWELCKNEAASAEGNYGDWLTTAINQFGGWIGEFWVHYCSHLRRRTGDNWHGVPESLQSVIEEALRGTNRPKVHARIALTPWVGYFFLWDRQFAIDWLLPLFDWERDAIVAQQSWSVIIQYDRNRTMELEELLRPFYKQCAERADQLDEESLSRFGHRLAALAIHGITNPVESGFFRDFLPLLPDEARSSLAYGMRKEWEDLDDGEREKLWNTRLKQYLDLRLVGVPVALSTGEARQMLEWCLHLEPVFDEAVERIIRMPQKDVRAYGLIRDLAASSVVERWPLHACRLAVAALKSEEYPLLHDSLLTLYDRLKDSIRREPDFKTFEELLFRRGWQKP